MRNGRKDFGFWLFGSLPYLYLLERRKIWLLWFEMFFSDLRYGQLRSRSSVDHYDLSYFLLELYHLRFWSLLHAFGGGAVRSVVHPKLQRKEESTHLAHRAGSRYQGICEAW